MFGGVLQKTLYEKRWSLLGWGIGTFLLVLYVISVFHSFSGGTFDSTLKQLPASLKGLLGDANSYNNIAGYVHQQVFVRTFPIFMVVFAVILFTGVIAGDEGEGTLQIVLAQPVSRTKLVLLKLLAAVVLTAGLCLAVFLAVMVAMPLIHESIDPIGVLEATFSLWLLTLVFGTFAFMLGAATGKRGMSGSVAGSVAFSTFLVSSLAVGVKSLQKIDTLSPFHYYGTDHNIITSGLQGKSVLVLVGLSGVFSVIALILFRRRDIYLK